MSILISHFCAREDRVRSDFARAILLCCVVCSAALRLFHHENSGLSYSCSYNSINQWLSPHDDMTILTRWLFLVRSFYVFVFSVFTFRRVFNWCNIWHCFLSWFLALALSLSDFNRKNFWNWDSMWFLLFEEKWQIFHLSLQ